MSSPLRSMLASGARVVLAAASLSVSLDLAAEPVDAQKVEQWGAPKVLAEAEGLTNQPIDAELREALAKRATVLLLEVNVQEPGEYATLRRLIETAAPAFDALSEEQKQRLESLLETLAATEDAATFEQLQARVALLNAAGKHDATAVGTVETWLGSRDLSSLGVEQVSWCLAESLPHRTDVNAFRVVWEGTLTAPRTGRYEFSTTPINVNRAGRDVVKHSLIAKVGDVEVLRTPQEPPAEEDDAKVARSGLRPPVAVWKPVGSAVDLTANQAVAMRVELLYQAAQPSAAAPPSAILSWKGPGLERQAISRSALAGPQGEPGGLRAEYRWGVNGQEQTAVEEGAVADVVWSTPTSIASQDLKLVERLSDRLWSLAASEEYLQRCAAGEATHVYLQSPEAVGLLTSAQRQEFLELLGERPELLQEMSDVQLLSLYRGVRFGAEEAAIELLGAWMQQRADVQPEIVADFFEQNRRVYWGLGQLLAMQQPEGLDRLRDDYLANEDDRCVLPVAYTLAYGYLALDNSMAVSRSQSKPERRLVDWVKFLNEKLADDSLSPDERTNWLIARAHAAEIQYGAGASAERLSSGKGWLDEASLTVDSNEIQFRLALERAARGVARGRLKESYDELQAAADQFGSPSDRQDISRVKETIKAIEAQKQRQQVAWQLAKKQSYRSAMQTRLAQAKQRGDDEEIAYLEQLLQPGD